MAANNQPKDINNGVNIRTGEVPKFQMVANIEELKKNAMIQIYLNKATNGKYVLAVNNRFKNITNEDFVRLVECVKIVNLAYQQDKELLEKIKGWTSGIYAASQPSLKLKKAVDDVERIIKANGGVAGEKFSWGAFVQAFQERITPLTQSLMFLQPMAQSFNYSRAAYMIMDSESAFTYISIRTTACIMLLDLIVKGCGEKEVFAALGKQGASREMSKLILEKNTTNKFLPSRAEVEEAKLGEVPITRFDSKQPTHLVVAAYMVDFRFYLQSLNFRVGKAKAADFARAKDLIIMVLKKFGSQVKGTINLKGLGPDGTRENWWNEYFLHVKNLRAVVRATKRVVNSPESVNSTNGNAVRNYSDWKVDI